MQQTNRRQIFYSFESINSSLAIAIFQETYPMWCPIWGCIIFSNRHTFIFHLSHATFSVDCMLSPFIRISWLSSLLAGNLSTPLLQSLHTSLMGITVNLCQISPHLIHTPPWKQGNPSKMQVKEKLMSRTDFATFILHSVQWLPFSLKIRSLSSWHKDPSERHWRCLCLLPPSHLSSLPHTYPQL